MTNTTTYRVHSSRLEIIRQLHEIADGTILASECGDLKIEEAGNRGIIISRAFAERVADLLER